MAQRIEFFEQQRIDPSAMFYTEVEAMDEIRQRMDQHRRQDAWRFWRPFAEGRLHNELPYRPFRAADRREPQ